MQVGSKTGAYFRYSRKSLNGFTIVELLIVIVVIGILAAIAILAYSGIQQKAVAASLTTDLENSAKQLKIYQASNSAYPIGVDCSASPAANTICLKSSNGTSYTTFTPNNTDPQTFCLTATNGTTNYYVNQDGAPASGGCTITNLVRNPSIETNNADWGVSQGNGGAVATGARVTSSTPYGSTFYRETWSTAPTVAGSEYVQVAGVATNLVDAGRTYTFRGTGRASWSGAILKLTVVWQDSAGSSITSVSSPTQAVTVNQWTDFTFTGIAPANAVRTRILIENVGTFPAAGSTLDMDGVMLTGGPTPYAYADGSSAGWSWTGTAHASTSTGVPL